MNKYKDLPDIDTSNKEIFESSDQENDSDIDQIDRIEEEFKDVNFDEKRLAFSKFNIINADKFDFSGNVLNSMGYQIEDKSREETIDEKLARIKRELEEIRQTQNVNVDELINETSELESKRNQPKLAEDKSSSTSINVLNLLQFESKPLELNSNNLNQISDLENKLNKLETIIGTGLDSEDQTSSIQSNINEVERRLNILEHPEYNSTSISNKIEKMTKEMNRLELNKKIYGIDNDSENEVILSKIDNKQRVDEIYNILPDLEKYLSHAPVLLQRIKNLNKLHNELSESISLTTNLDSMMNNMTEEFKKWDNSITDLDSKLNSQIENFHDNSKSIDNRITELLDRIKDVSN
ncbi:uncharacterized protein KGF55_002285 [Candida pseudojiufengensis]|uniref:uncharacterized protein n=1 Tax=Candida pseudojiufengensis TaxID=497109 RepID=UPI002224F899|nr:uncharacterized protein KGF55_002285 [Candida pseudojiufengensis]KAI5964343.1 hypothetical protein KGF55_002285 [Candida pseudojiufengensis]